MEAAARTQHTGDDLRPTNDVGQPVQRADTGEDEIETLGTKDLDGVYSSPATNLAPDAARAASARAASSAAGEKS